MSPEAVIDRYCEVWSVADPDRRAALLATVWAEGGSYTDPTVHAAGASALLEHIASVLARRPGSRVQRVGAVAQHHDVARFDWQAVAADGEVLRRGLDIVIFDAAGRLVRVIGFFET
jgi:hypothetical protein